MVALVKACFPDVQAPVPLSYFTGGMSLALSLLTTFGNLSICLAVIVDPYKKLRTPFSYFLVNLALSDLLAGVVMLPVSVAVHLAEASGNLPARMVQLLHMCFFISATASVISMAFLLLDRFTAIKWPITYRRRLSTLRCILISMSIWLFAILVSTPYLRIGYTKYLMVFVHTSVAVTFLIIVITYAGVYRGLHSGTLAGGNVRNEVSEINRLKREKRVTRAFLWILILFITSYVPAIVMIYILEFCQTCSCSFRHVLRDLQFILISSNSAMNPMVCAIRLRAFRDSILAMLTSTGAWKGILKDGSIARPERSVTQTSLGSLPNSVCSTPPSTREAKEMLSSIQKKIASANKLSNQSTELQTTSTERGPKAANHKKSTEGISSRTNEAFEYNECILKSNIIYGGLPVQKETKL